MVSQRSSYAVIATEPLSLGNRKLKTSSTALHFGIEFG